MIKRTFLWAWGERIRIARYLVSGFVAVALDWGVYYIATRFFHISQVPANIFSVLVGGTWAFLINKFWSFEVKHNTARQSRRFVILFIFNYLFQQYGFFVALSYIHIYDLFAKFGLIAIMVSWNFLLYKYWVYAVE